MEVDPGDSTKAIIPEKIDGKVVTEIGEAAFRSCTKLTEVVMPDTITSMGTWTFRNCSNLKKVTFSKNLYSIGYNAFFYCTSLEEVEIPDRKSVV